MEKKFALGGRFSQCGEFELTLSHFRVYFQKIAIIENSKKSRNSTNRSYKNKLEKEDDLFPKKTMEGSFFRKQWLKYS